jgi:hypothetical protein
MSTTTTSLSGPELAGVVVEVLVQGEGPLTLAQLRDRLRRHRVGGEAAAEELRQCVEGLAAQGKVHAWPAYRSKSPRYAGQSMDDAARAALARLLAEEAFTRAELVAAVRRAVPGLEAPRSGELVDEVLAAGNVRKLPPRLGSASHLLGTPHPRSYLAPLFGALGKSLARLLPRLESEGVPAARVIEEARSLWEQALRQAQEGSPEPAPDGPAQEHGPDRAVLEAAERLAGPGAEVSVRDLRRQAGQGVSRDDFDQALLRLAREGRLELRPHTPHPGSGQPAPEQVVTGPDGRLFDRVARRA